ncbi:MAG: NADH-ubiquinone/plastoquinone oxidoreductase, subunit [Vampirovibrio sp.]|jgi:NAD(P)H-quinone oxidoreductase subunit 2|nr:NADH-ubiquinone/plastoquinone oxidoreductase, subunit [Vampirovibrio sp.]
MSDNFLTSLMDFIKDNNISLISPELLLTFVIMLCVCYLAFSKSLKERQDIWNIATAGTFGALVILTVFWNIDYVHSPNLLSVSVLNGMFKADLFSLLVRTLLVAGTFLVLLFTRTFIDKRAEVPGEFYVLLLSALLGGMMLSGATDLIMVFVALETLSISSYLLAGYMRGNILSYEAGLKYLLYGSMATAVLLFGLSLLYGLTGYTAFPQMLANMPSYASVSPIIWSLMAIMIVGGIAFKLSAAPFHMWAPDTYEGAPTPVVAFLSVISKIAAFALAIRLFTLVFGTNGAFNEGWMGLLSTLAVVSMVLGNVVALAQRNIKRLMAYSTVAHVGYLLLGFVVMNQQNAGGLGSMVYYLITYLFMNLGAFAVVTHMENLTGRTDIAAYAGLVRKKPFVAAVLSIMFLSLAGIPITAGFFGKFFLFQAVANAGSQYLWLVIVALLTSTISLYYYLNVIRLMVIAEPSDAVEALPVNEPSARLFTPVGLTLAICAVGTVLVGVFSNGLLELSNSAVHDLQVQSMLSHTQQQAPQAEISKAR